MRGALLFLALLSTFLFFFRLGARDLETTDEAGGPWSYRR